MKHSRAELKQMARAALSGKWRTAVLFTILTFIVTLALSFCSRPFESNTSFMGTALYWLVTTITSLISGLFSVGSAYFYLNICRGREYRLTDLFAAFRMNPDRFLIVSLITSIPTFLSTLPAYLWVPTENELIAYALITLTASFIVSIISIIIALFFALSNYLLLDFPEMGAISALRMSATLMHGNKARYFFLELSFIGWIFLGIFTLGIALLWIYPYMNMTFAYFYADVLNQLDDSNEDIFADEADADEAGEYTNETFSENDSFL